MVLVNYYKFYFTILIKQIKSKDSRWKETIKSRADINEIKKKSKKKITGANSWFFPYPQRFYLFIFRERGREGEREQEKHQCVDASCMPQTGDLAHHLGMCLDWELNWQPFSLQACTHPLSYTSQGWFFKRSFKLITLVRLTMKKGEEHKWLISEMEEGLSLLIPWHYKPIPWKTIYQNSLKEKQVIWMGQQLLKKLINS